MSPRAATVAIIALGSCAGALAEARSTSTPMGFRSCVASIDIVARQAGDRPTVVVDSPIMKVVRFSTADGSLLVTCSAPDRKRILTESSRR